MLKSVRVEGIERVMKDDLRHGTLRGIRYCAVCEKPASALSQSHGSDFCREIQEAWRLYL